MDNVKKNESYIDDDARYLPCIPTPFGMIPLVGATMTTDRECELFGKEVQTKVLHGRLPDQEEKGQRR